MAKYVKDDNWPELDPSLNKHEIKYSGPSFTEKLERTEGLLSKNLFLLTSLNFLELSDSILSEIPPEIGNFKVLTNLVLRSNRLKSLPTAIGQLTKLKYLNVSYNEIAEIPLEFYSCVDLQTFNASHNKISEFPSEFSNLTHLAHLDVSFNEFVSFPESICVENCQHLAEINFKSNKIPNIPVEIRRLSALKILDLTDNCVEIVPGELGECQKLKDLFLENNRLKDKRLAKLISQCQQKAILDYVRKNCPKMAASKLASTKDGQKHKSSSKVSKSVKNESKSNEDGEKESWKDKIIILPCSEELKITMVSDAVSDVRPFLLCCILKNLHFADSKSLKKFIALQSKIHDEECKKRVAATVATHDLNKICFPVVYTAKAPEEITIFPLMRQKESTAEELMAKLNEEAENLRKEKKRNVYSGIHQYLYLLKDKTKYPCLIDGEKRVISFPPITNSDLTKISEETTEILIEISSSQNLPTCKRIMEILLKQILHLNLDKSQQNNDSDESSLESVKKSNVLTIQQVKIYSENEQQLKATFPSKNDLIFEDVDLVRDWMKGED